MTGKERIIKALKHEEPDRVPTMEWIIHPNTIRALTGKDTEIEFVREMGLDGILLRPDSRKEKVDDRHYRDEWGVVRVSYDEYPNPVSHPVQTEKDLETLSIPDPDADFRYKSIREGIGELGDEKAIAVQIRDVFSQPRDLLGYENFLVGFYTQPELVTRLMEISVDYSTALARNMRGLGVEIILTADDIADSGNLLVPPEVYREMILPHYARLVKNFKELGFLVIKHTDGNITELMEDIIGTGIDCFDPVDPSAGLDIGKFKEDYGSRICLKGNINCATTLVSGTRQEVIDETRKCIRKASFGGGHIISSSNTIHSGVNPENYRTFLEAVEEYGHYPLDMDKLGS